jgi:Ca2+/Na+ antiporter
MDHRVKKTVGIILGMVFLIFGVRYFLYSYRDGNPKWFMIVMVCGMLLMLYYTLLSRRNHEEDEDDYS